MKTICGLKDTLKVHLDMKEANIRPEFHPLDDGGNGVTFLPVAP